MLLLLFTLVVRNIFEKTDGLVFLWNMKGQMVDRLELLYQKKKMVDRLEGYLFIHDKDCMHTEVEL